jgi:hypothetical protein
MDARPPSQLFLLFALLSTLGLVSSGVSAQDAPTTDPQAVPQLSLAGPVTELVVGGTLVLATPFVAGLTALALGPEWFSCGWEEVDSECERERDAQQRQAAGAALGVGIAVGALGLVLLGHGGYRTKRVRNARRAALGPSAWNIEASQQRARMTFAWTF